MAPNNKQVVLARYAEGSPKESDFRIVEQAVPELLPGEFLVRSIYLSVDPFLRMQMNPTTPQNLTSRKYGVVTDVGRVMAGGVLGEVVASHHPTFSPGEIVEGILGWQTQCVTTGWINKRHNPLGVVKCDLSLNVPLSAFASVLGRAGLTPYYCMTRELRPRKGDTVVITSAAGAGGSIAGQIAKMEGCRVVGLTSSDKKVKYITEELGFDVGINYRTTNDLTAALRKACPNGVDIHYDNVGGEMAATIMALHAPGHRYRLVGLASEYNTIPKDKPFWPWPYHRRQFVVHDYIDDYENGIREMAWWIKEGTLKYREQIYHGIDQTPKAFADLFRSQNIGKALVKVGDEPRPAA
ncbi:MAG: NADP-dependent oxidoreductase [Alphaproteobacteria bacterium]|nr:NADP-dependent oxidoreductase [Alphaproteobacteria bacterium]